MQSGSMPVYVFKSLCLQCKHRSGGGQTRVYGFTRATEMQPETFQKPRPTGHFDVDCRLDFPQ